MFEIKLIILRTIGIVHCNFQNFYGRYVLQYKSILTIYKILWNINFILLRRKIIDDYRLQLSQFVSTLRSVVQVVFNNFFLMDATDTSKISSDQERLFFAVNLYPLFIFSRTLPLSLIPLWVTIANPVPNFLAILIF